MVKKVVDVPDNADYITAHEQINAGGSFLLQKYNVADLPDAPTVAESATVEKRVIELPDDVIEGVQNTKYYWENVAGFVLNVPSIVFPEIRKSIGEPHASYDKVADILGSWYFGNIEFAVKKEKTWIVERKVNGDYKYVGVYQDGTINFMAGHAPESLYSEITNDGMIKTEFTEEIADEIIAGLGGEDGLLKLRKVKVEE
jgi:hypothetical protein